jgi:hypothetical protein
MEFDRDLTDPDPEDPTDPSLVDGHEPTDRIGFRDEPTAPAEARTTKLAVAPWLMTAEPAPRAPRAHDPLFWPFVVFVAIFAVCAAFSLFAPHPTHPGAAQLVTSP